MTWIKLDTGIIRHPKVASLSPLGFRFYVSSVCYAGDYRTSGWVPKGALRGLVGGTKRPQKVADELVAAGLWEPVEDGWRIHNFAKYQGSSAQIAADDNGGPSRARSRARTHARTRAPEDVDVDVEKKTPLTPQGGRAKDRASHKEDFAAWSLEEFPDYPVKAVAHYASLLRARHIEPTVDALRPLLEHNRGVLL